MRANYCAGVAVPLDVGAVPLCVCGGALRAAASEVGIGVQCPMTRVIIADDVRCGGHELTLAKLVLIGRFWLWCDTPFET